MDLSDVLDTVGAALVFLGSLLSLVAAIGVLRLPDLLTRMHAATKPQVLGLMLMLTGLGLVLRDPTVVLFLLLVLLAQMATAPVAGHMVGRASYRAGQVDDDLLVVDELSDDLPTDRRRGRPATGDPDGVRRS